MFVRTYLYYPSSLLVNIMLLIMAPISIARIIEVSLYSWDSSSNSCIDNDNPALSNGKKQKLL